MKIEELRIGNLVKLVFEESQKESIIEWDEVDFFQYKVRLKHLQPIPLTEELLLKFGFEEKVFRDNEDLSFDRFSKKGFAIERLNDEDFFISENIDQMIGNFDIKIKSVHQLQNLYYALTGEELTLKNE